MPRLRGFSFTMIFEICQSRVKSSSVHKLVISNSSDEPPVGLECAPSGGVPLPTANLRASAGHSWSITASATISPKTGSNL